MINKIYKNGYSQQEWDSFTDDPYDYEVSEGSIKYIYKISEEYFPEYSELFGYWESTWFELDDSFYEFPPCELSILTRTVLKSETVIKNYWESCE